MWDRMALEFQGCWTATGWRPTRPGRPKEGVLERTSQLPNRPTRAARSRPTSCMSFARGSSSVERAYAFFVVSDSRVRDERVTSRIKLRTLWLYREGLNPR